MVERLSIREERELKHFETLAKEHGYDWWGNQTSASKIRIQRRINLLKELLNINPGDKVLECGCGSGNFTLNLASSLEDGISIYAIDLSESQLKIAANKVQRTNVTFLTRSITKSEFNNGFFDFVIGNSILHHLDIDSALKEIKRILKPGGKLLFFEPNMMNPQIWLSFNIKYFRKLHEASPDEKAFWRWEIKKKLVSLNFKNVIVKPFDFIYPLIPENFLKVAKKIGSVLEKTFVNEIAGSLLVYAENRNQVSTN